MDFMRGVIDASLPSGSLWNPAPGGGFDLLLDGIAKNHQDVYDYLGGLADVRDPRTTAMLSELEAEFGLPDGATLTDSVRRARMVAVIYNRGNTGTWRDLQDALQASGFNANVYENDPAIDPAILLDQAFAVTAGETNAIAGNSAAFARRIGGYILSAGDVYSSRNNYTVSAGSGVYAAVGGATAGEYDGLVVENIITAAPPDPGDWSSVFFVGGDVIRDAITNEILGIQEVNVPLSRKPELDSLVLRYKPVDTWAAMIIIFT